jgi:hypothetical protein
LIDDPPAVRVDGSFAGPTKPSATIRRMIRIREIDDPDLRQRIVAALAERRGMSVAAIPDWFELDDLDYVDLLNDLKERESDDYDPRM